MRSNRVQSDLMSSGIMEMHWRMPPFFKRTFPMILRYGRSSHSVAPSLSCGVFSFTLTYMEKFWIAVPRYVELLELRMKQMEEEFAEGKLRMVQDHREALGIHEMEKHQLEQRIRENHEVDEAEKKDLVAFMEAEKLELQQRKDKELALEREKITQLTQMVEEVQRDLVEDLDMKEEKIKQLKIQIAMSESSDIVEKLAQFQNTIAMLQEQLANEMIKRKTCETKLKTTEASLNVLAISKEI
eukprot:CAMPEP_0114232898 /NCGR_PEP_ID=MMETSP0058-20121206/4862_1 /TAXON_ID=36894 /ORGANISM="Pyramimonas parkeae, CCMP726" /LENGTH=241 /DNA_ID=CAMNT_0001344423 /DNA_START=96 /DNA_END=821 /DNA_ORIENTATION=+